MTQLKSILLASLILIAGAGGLALAEGGKGGNRGNGGKRAAMMQKFDKNGDGQLDPAERAAMKQARAAQRAERKAARVAQFDADKDGALSPAERAAMKDQRARQRFAKLDANGDGKLSLDEFKAAQGHGRRGHGHRGMGRGGAGGGAAHHQ